MIKTKGVVLIVKDLHDRIDSLVAQAYGWPEALSDEDILARPKPQRKPTRNSPRRFVEAKMQKPLFPTNDPERTAAVFAALMQADKPLVD